MLAGNPFFNPYSNSYTSLQTVTVGSGGASSITFSSIPSTYTHLQIRALSQNAQSTTGYDQISMRFNGDTGTNYTDHYIIGNGSTASANAETSVTSIRKIGVSGESGSANVFGANIIDILDYANTNKYKTARGLYGRDGNTNNTDGIVVLASGLWLNTAAITSITLFDITGFNFTQNSSFALYGVN